MTTIPFIQFGPFLGGIDNVNSAKSLPPDNLRECSGLDIDNAGYLTVQPSLTTVTATGTRGLYSNISSDMCLLLQGTTLKRMNTDESTTTIRSGMSSELSMSYDEINNMIYYSNGQVIEMTDSFSITSFQDAFDADMTIEDKPFKRAMFPGSIIAFYNNRLYAVLGGRIAFSDVMHFTSRDNRYCRIYVPGLITMFKPVGDGIWISFGGKTYFMQGTGPEDFALIEKAAYGALGQAVDAPRELIGAEGFSGKSIMWMSEKGICIGGDGGAFFNLSIKKYQIPADAISGASFVRIKNDGVAHFISSVISNS